MYKLHKQLIVRMCRALLSSFHSHVVRLKLTNIRDTIGSVVTVAYLQNVDCSVHFLTQE